MKKQSLGVRLKDATITPSDLRGFVPVLAKFNEPFSVWLDVSGNASALSVAQLRATSIDGNLDVTVSGHLNNLMTPSKCRSTCLE